MKENICFVLQMKLNGQVPMGKHEAHTPHLWWYTYWNGGHQLDDDWQPDGTITYFGGNTVGVDSHEGEVYRHRCPGLDSPAAVC